MVNDATLQIVQLICLGNKLLYTYTTLHDYRYKFMNIWIQRKCWIYNFLQQY